MGEPGAASVGGGGLADGFQPKALALASCGQVVTAAYSQLAVEGVGGYHVNGSTGVRPEHKIDEAVLPRQISAGQYGVFQYVSQYAAKVDVGNGQRLRQGHFQLQGSAVTFGHLQVVVQQGVNCSIFAKELTFLLGLGGQIFVQIGSYRLQVSLGHKAVQGAYGVFEIVPGFGGILYVPLLGQVKAFLHFQYSVSFPFLCSIHHAGHYEVKDHAEQEQEQGQYCQAHPVE